jgi:hypothetical protein
MPQEKTSSAKAIESLTVEGVELFYTYRGYDNDIETYTAQAGNKTYSLYRKNNEGVWRCDWTSSYNCQPITLDADANDKEAMLKAFAAMLKSLHQGGGH